MSMINGKMVGFAVLLSGCISAAHADTVTLSGNGVTIRYEDKASAVTGAPSLIATGLMTSPASVAGARFDSTAAVREPASGAAFADVAGLGGGATRRSFAEGVALQFSLGGAGAGEGGFESLVLAGLALFALIVRQRISAMSRSRHSPIFQ